MSKILNKICSNPTKIETAKTDTYHIEKLHFNLSDYHNSGLIVLFSNNKIEMPKQLEKVIPNHYTFSFKVTGQTLRESLDIPPTAYIYSD